MVLPSEKGDENADFAVENGKSTYGVTAGHQKANDLGKLTAGR